MSDIVLYMSMVQYTGVHWTSRLEYTGPVDWSTLEWFVMLARVTPLNVKQWASVQEV